MAESRIEKFKEYRKSIISDDSSVLKTPIDTELQVTSGEKMSFDHSEEAILLKKLTLKKRLLFFLFIIAVLLILVGIIFGGVYVFSR